jgi:hypothetical protein
MTLLSPEEALTELRKIVEHFDATNCVFRSNHASNYFSIRGTIPDDRQEILDAVDRALQNSNFRQECWRAL